jgi:sugar phosphate permease
MRQGTTMHQATAGQITRWQKKMFWLMWTTYASFYLLRVNISVAVPAIMQEFSLSKVEMGMVLSRQSFL